MQLQLGIRQIISSDCKHVFTFYLLLTWLFPFSLHAPFCSIFHYHYLIFTLSSFVIFPWIPPSLLIFFSVLSLIPFLVPSIPSLLSLYLSLQVQPLLAFLKTSLLFRFPFLRITLPFSFRILFVIPLETQRTPEGGNPKYFSKLSGDVVLWECEWDSLTTEKVLWNQSSTRGSARTQLQPLHLSFSLPVFSVASLPASLKEQEDGRGCCDISAVSVHWLRDCKAAAVREELLSYEAGMWPNPRLLLPHLLNRGHLGLNGFGN